MGHPPKTLRRRHVHTLILAGSALLGLAALINPTDEAEATRHTAADNTLEAAAGAAALTLSLPLPSGTGEAPAPAVEQPVTAQWHEVTVRSGDTLAAIFDRLHLSPRVLHSLLEADRTKTATLKQLLPGQTLRFRIEGEHQLVAMQYQMDRTTILDISRNAESYQAQQISRPIETRLAYRTASIESSLFTAGQRVGLSDTLIMELATIFGWDIDFALDIRGGDSFTVVYEEEYLDGERLRDGTILAAEFINQGHSYQAIRFTDSQGNSSYYTPDGHSMRKAFLRSPVDFNRISSGFQTERYHPVLGVKRPHRGVDYAAAIGTPIKASGDGKIEFRGRKGGYGNTIIIQHGGAYRTLYAHLSSFRSGVKAGSRVKQGQVIGYVGKTGIATGPHLHYEFLVNGVHRNPLTVKLPNASPLPAQYRDSFQHQTQLRLAQLETVKRTTVALNTR